MSQAFLIFGEHPIITGLVDWLSSPAIILDVVLGGYYSTITFFPL